MSVVKVYNAAWLLYDTGFGDRIQQWEVAYKLCRNNNFSHTILVEDYAWMETKFIDFPYTDIETIGNYEMIKHQNIRVDNIGNLSTELDKNKCYFLDPRSMFFRPPSEMVSILKLKDKDFENTIKEKVKDRIGIHVRNWPHDLDDHRQDIADRFDYDTKIKKVREVLDRYPNEKFYLSSDFTYGGSPSKVIFPQFEKSYHPLSSIYNDYDIIDYRDIVDFKIPIDIPISVPDRNIGFDCNWQHQGKDRVIFINQDGLIYSSKTNTSESSTIKDLCELKVKRDIVDLFSLIYSKEFIHSMKTGPFSSFSIFIMEYRKRSSEDE